jgi:hypothetical protein
MVVLAIILLVFSVLVIGVIIYRHTNKFAWKTHPDLLLSLAILGLCAITLINCVRFLIFYFGSR